MNRQNDIIFLPSKVIKNNLNLPKKDQTLLNVHYYAFCFRKFSIPFCIRDVQKKLEKFSFYPQEKTHPQVIPLLDCSVQTEHFPSQKFTEILQKIPHHCTNLVSIFILPSTLNTLLLENTFLLTFVTLLQIKFQEVLDHFRQ